MLIDNYSAQRNKIPNYDSIKLIDSSDLTMTVSSFVVPTTEADVFEKYSPWQLRELFDIQYAAMEKELVVLLKYGLISKAEADRTQKQYRQLYFHEGYVYLKDSLIEQSEVDRRVDVVVKKRRFELPELMTDDEEMEEPEEIIRPKAKDWVVWISKSAIRSVTWYSYNVRTAWNNYPVEITWQKELIDATENIIVVDGSRQGWKSLTIAEKVIEESFIPWKDILIAAFLQETTESIWEYMLDFIERFDDNTFTIKERKRYIQNNESGVRIHFRTLKDWAKGIRWKTLRMIVVDEAMLVPTNIFKSVLLPTQTTIKNPILILLWTASENTSCYMYKTITAIKKSTIYNNKWQKTARHIRFSILENPLVSPIMKQEILDDQESPDTQREYFNRWGKLDDSLFQPKRTSLSTITDEFSPQAHILLAIDPARKKDRSAYSVIHCLNWKAIIVESWEVPPAYKTDWSLQAKFFLNLTARYKNYKSFSATIDCTGVWDWVTHIFRQHWLNIQDTVRYTAWDTESIQSEGNYVIGKSLLINNTIDMMTENTLIIPYEINNLLLEELEFIQMSETRWGKIAFRSDYYDDITNSMMIGLYIARKRRFINRISIDTVNQTTFDDELRASYQTPKRFRHSQQNQWW